MKILAFTSVSVAMLISSYASYFYGVREGWKSASKYFVVEHLTASATEAIAIVRGENTEYHRKIGITFKELPYWRDLAGDEYRIYFDRLDSLVALYNAELMKTEPNQAPETMILTVTDRAPSSTLRASEDRVSP